MSQPPIETRIVVLYVGTSLISPLRKAESDMNRRSKIKVRVSAHNCGGPLTNEQASNIEQQLISADIVFLIHVTDPENASIIMRVLDRPDTRPEAVIVFNCMPDLMRRMRLGKLRFSSKSKDDAEDDAPGMLRSAVSWMAEYVRRRNGNKNGKNGHAVAAKAGSYVNLISKLPTVLKFVPTAGKLTDAKHYLFLFAYFLQPTPRNIRSMLLYSIKHYLPSRAENIRIGKPEVLPAVGIYHPDADGIFDGFEEYRDWYRSSAHGTLDPAATVGMLLLRPQIVSNSVAHYAGLIRAIEKEGLSVIPAISTLMDNREACLSFFVDGPQSQSVPRISQIVSLTGFSFVGGPAMNDSEAALEFLKPLGLPFRSMISLDIQAIEDWDESRLGLNPIQTAMQIAIPEIDGATESFIFGGLSKQKDEPLPLEERCTRIARRLARWNRLRTSSVEDMRLGILLFCFPPDKGNLGTAADLDVFRSLFEMLGALEKTGYRVDLPGSADGLRQTVLGDLLSDQGQVGNVAYRMGVDEYRRLCPYVDEIEREWGRAPGSINSNGRELLILGAQFGNVFVGIQPTFGYEGDPMRLIAAESGSPHHGYMALYTYLQEVLRADAVVHLGTHGSTEFMPGKQAGLSGKCWPDRLIGELPNIYVYSVNNPSEGTIAKRRSYGELISYLTPPIENAGLYKELASIKDLVMAFRTAEDEKERRQLFDLIEEKAASLNL